MLLHLALEEGFAGDKVVIHVAGQEVYTKEGVKTRLQIGLADQLEAPVDAGSARVEIDLPDKALSGEKTLRVDADVYVGISVRQGRLVWRVSDQRTGYV